MGRVPGKTWCWGVLEKARASDSKLETEFRSMGSQTVCRQQEYLSLYTSSGSLPSGSQLTGLAVAGASHTALHCCSGTTRSWALPTRLKGPFGDSKVLPQVSQRSEAITVPMTLTMQKALRNILTELSH